MEHLPHRWDNRKQSSRNNPYNCSIELPLLFAVKSICQTCQVTPTGPFEYSIKILGIEQNYKLITYQNNNCTPADMYMKKNVLRALVGASYNMTSLFCSCCLSCLDNTWSLFRSLLCAVVNPLRVAAVSAAISKHGSMGRNVGLRISLYWPINDRETQWGNRDLTKVHISIIVSIDPFHSDNGRKNFSDRQYTGRQTLLSLTDKTVPRLLLWLLSVELALKVKV